MAPTVHISRELLDRLHYARSQRRPRPFLQDFVAQLLEQGLEGTNRDPVAPGTELGAAPLSQGSARSTRRRPRPEPENGSPEAAAPTVPLGHALPPAVVADGVTVPRGISHGPEAAPCDPGPSRGRRRVTAASVPSST